MKKRTPLLVGMLLLILGACAPAQPAISEPPTLVTLEGSPTSTLTPVEARTDIPTATTELVLSETPSLTPTLVCERETASVVLSVSSENVKVGDPIKVTVTVNNEGCTVLGLPQYSLYVQSDGTQSIFTPENPEPVVHYLGVGLGQSDAAEFEFIAAAGGQARLTATVSYEVHLGYPGPAYWGMTATREPLSITVAP